MLREKSGDDFKGTLPAMVWKFTFGLRRSLQEMVIPLQPIYSVRLMKEFAELKKASEIFLFVRLNFLQAP